MNRKKGFYYLKIFLLLSVAAILLWVGYRGLHYYLENDRYAHYIAKSLFQFRSPVVEDGYTGQTSYFPGDTQQVYVNASEEGTHWLRLYDVSGQVADSIPADIYSQSPRENGATEGFGYKPSFEYKIPESLKSGLYLWEKCIPFILKGQEEAVAILYPVNTIQAYNVTGGKSFYSLFSEQSPVISLQRPVFPPVSFQVYEGMKFFRDYQKYPLRYLTDQDMEQYASLSGVKVLVVAGHNEYWTRNARKNFDRFVAEGGHVMLLSGNTMWWQVRYDSLQQQLICYKQLPDPVKDPELKTIHWPDPSLNYPVIPSIGASFIYGGFGRKFEGSFGGFKVTDEHSPLLKGTGLGKGDVLSVPTKEYDGAPLEKNPAGDYKLMKDVLPFAKSELIAWDRAYDDDAGYGTFLIFQKNDSSGIVINTATMDWCSGYGMGGRDSLRIKQITSNMLEGLMEGEDLFSPEVH